MPSAGWSVGNLLAPSTQAWSPAGLETPPWRRDEWRRYADMGLIESLAGQRSIGAASCASRLGERPRSPSR